VIELKYFECVLAKLFAAW